MRISEAQRLAHETAKAKGWWNGVLDADPVLVPAALHIHIPGLLCLIHSEVSEALEDYREGKLRLQHTDDGKPVGLPSELADVVIRVLDMSGALGIDLESVIAEKMAYNERRPYRHGGKRL